jgi:hypothetical protein
MLPARKDHVGTVYNLAVSGTEPTVVVQVRAFTLEDESSPDYGKQIVVARLEPGSLPPYAARGRGIKVRVGDADVAASVGAIERLFERRNQSEQLTGELRGEFQKTIPGKGPTAIFGLYVAPLSRTVRIPRVGAADRAISEAVWGYLFPRSVEPKRNPEGLRFDKSLDEWVYIAPSGLVHSSMTLEASTRPTVFLSMSSCSTPMKCCDWLHGCCPMWAVTAALSLSGPTSWDSTTLNFFFTISRRTVRFAAPRAASGLRPGGYLTNKFWTRKTLQLPRNGSLPI